MDVNKHLGARLRFRRKQLGLSQREVGNKMGLRFQQVQKYEVGECRMTAERVLELAGVLNVPAGYFFDGLEQVRANAPTALEKAYRELGRTIGVV